MRVLANHQVSESLRRKHVRIKVTHWQKQGPQQEQKKGGKNGKNEVASIHSNSEKQTNKAHACVRVRLRMCVSLCVQLPAQLKLTRLLLCFFCFALPCFLKDRRGVKRIVNEGLVRDDLWHPAQGLMLDIVSCIQQHQCFHAPHVFSCGGGSAKNEEKRKKREERGKKKKKKKEEKRRRRRQAHETFQIWKGQKHHKFGKSAKDFAKDFATEAMEAVSLCDLGADVVGRIFEFLSVEDRCKVSVQTRECVHVCMCVCMLFFFGVFVFTPELSFDALQNQQTSLRS